MHTIIKGGRKNQNEWFERIVEYYIEYQAVEYRELVQNIKNKFYIELHYGFLYTIPSMLYTFLLDKGADDIVDYRPPLTNPPPNSNWRERQEMWEEFLEDNYKDTKEVWEYFLKK